MRPRSIVFGALALTVCSSGLVACASQSQPAATAASAQTPTLSQLKGTWRGYGRVAEQSGPIMLKIADDGSFTGTAGGAVVSGKMNVAGGKISFDSVGPKQGADGTLIYKEAGGKATLTASGEGKYAGTPVTFEVTRE